MTKADLLNKLRNLPMNADVVFAHGGLEFEPTFAYAVVGGRGLCLVLTDERATAAEYPDAEEVL